MDRLKGKESIILLKTVESTRENFKETISMGKVLCCIPTNRDMKVNLSQECAMVEEYSNFPTETDT